MRELALDVEHGPDQPAEQDPPEAGVGRVGSPSLLAEADERVLARQNQAMRIQDNHLHVLPMEPAFRCCTRTNCGQKPIRRQGMGELFRRLTIVLVTGIAGATSSRSSAILARGRTACSVRRLAATRGAISLSRRCEERLATAGAPRRPGQKWPGCAGISRRATGGRITPSGYRARCPRRRASRPPCGA